MCELDFTHFYSPAFNLDTALCFSSTDCLQRPQEVLAVVNVCVSP